MTALAQGGFLLVAEKRVRLLRYCGQCLLFSCHCAAGPSDNKGTRPAPSYSVFAEAAVASASPQVGDLEPSPQLRGR
jgi:hypothetical protein